MDVGLCLRLGVGLAAALGALHRRGIIHKDLTPGHVMIDVATGQVWLTGFRIASRLRRERQTPEPPEVIAGTLPYMAPEQTGRMNRSIDSRSDLYAFGVILYEMVTGTLPFTASDPMEWVHCHVARQPVPPAERATDVPAAVSGIIMRLLAKTAEQRYQTAAGVERDLRRCLTQWEAEHRIDDFRLGEHETPDRLLIPETMYGREREIATLLAAFDRVAETGTPELVLVSGYSGIGKSSVVNELHKALVPPRGLFASGKFDQGKRGIPYATLAQAFQSLVRRLLATSDAELAVWRAALEDALGPNGQVDDRPCPRTEADYRRAAAGPRAAAPRGAASVSAGPAAVHAGVRAAGASARAFRRRSAVARHGHPRLPRGPAGAVRRPPRAGHRRLSGQRSRCRPSPRTEARGDSRRGSGRARDRACAPRPTGRGATNRRCAALGTERVAALAQLVGDKTAGNPFFTTQFLTALGDEGLLTFDHAHARWSWDLDGIRAKRYTDNVADLMFDRLARLPGQHNARCSRSPASVTARR